jgi:ATP-dependent Clp protease ATP-binding subunit ClpC
VGTEHILLGLIKLGQGVAVNVLQKLGLDLDTVRMQVEQQVGTGPETKMVGNIPYTPRVKKVLALASKRGQSSESLPTWAPSTSCWDCCAKGEGVAAPGAAQPEINLEKTRNEILKELDPNFDPGEEESRGPENDEASKASGG